MQIWRSVLGLALIFMLGMHGARATDNAAFSRWVTEFRKTAVDNGIRGEVYDKATAGLTPDFKLPDLDIPAQARPEQAEFVKTPEQYLSGKQLATLEAQGRKLLIVQDKALDTIEQQYGVDRYILLGLWGRETAFGTYPNKHNAIQVLATQAFVGRRHDLFRKQFLAALRMVQDGIIDAKTAKSSWAGAMGLMQFLPTDYYEHAVDADGDGKADIWNSAPDALASLANNLKKLGWTAGQPWGVEVEASPRADCAKANLDVTQTIGEWKQQGVATYPSRPAPSQAAGWPASLLMPAGVFGPSFLTFQNFQVLRDYNKSDLYALFVGHLADRIRGSGEFIGKWRNVVQIPSKDVADMQKYLAAMGLYKDTVDAKAGGRTRSALGRYQKLAGLDQTCWPVPEVIAHLKANVPVAQTEEAPK